VETDDGQIILCLSIDEDGGLRALDAAGVELRTERYDPAGWRFAAAMQAGEAILELENCGLLVCGMKQADPGRLITACYCGWGTASLAAGSVKWI